MQHKEKLAVCSFLLSHSVSTLMFESVRYSGYVYVYKLYIIRIKRQHAAMSTSNWLYIANENSTSATYVPYSSNHFIFFRLYLIFHFISPQATKPFQSSVKKILKIFFFRFIFRIENALNIRWPILPLFHFHGFQFLGAI